MPRGRFTIWYADKVEVRWNIAKWELKCALIRTDCIYLVTGRDANGWNNVFEKYTD